MPFGFALPFLLVGLVGQKSTDWPAMGVVRLPDRGHLSSAWYNPGVKPAVPEWLEVVELSNGVLAGFDVRAVGLEKLRQTKLSLQTIMNRGGKSGVVSLKSLSAADLAAIALAFKDRPEGPMKRAGLAGGDANLLVLPSINFKVEVNGKSYDVSINPIHLDSQLVIKNATELPVSQPPSASEPVPAHFIGNDVVVVEFHNDLTDALTRSQSSALLFKEIEARLASESLKLAELTAKLWAECSASFMDDFRSLVPSAGDRLSFSDLDPRMKAILRESMITGLPLSARSDEFWQKAKLKDLRLGVSVGMFFKTGQQVPPGGGGATTHTGQVARIT